MDPTVEVATKEKFEQILDQSIYPDSGLNEQQQQVYIKRYSPSALILNAVYYFAMKDFVFGWLSFASAVIFMFSPIILLLPFAARRRAYKAREWHSFNHFYSVQRHWDRYAYWFFGLSLVILIGAFWLIGPWLSSTLKILIGSQMIDPTSVTDKLQNTVNSYQELLR